MGAGMTECEGVPMKFTQRVQQLPPYLFVEISRRIAAKRAEGKRVVTFGIGDPDLATPDPVLEELKEAAHHRPNHRYPETEGLPEFREAVAAWYATGSAWSWTRPPRRCR